MARGDLTVEEIMAILPETTGHISTLTAELSPAQLRTSPGADAWSINDVLAHLRACHDVLGGNMLRILAEDRPKWRAMNPRGWMKQTDYLDWEFAPAFAVFQKQRTELLAAIEPLAPEAWERTARVTGLPGGMTELDMRYYGSWMAGHERQHVDHISQIAAVVRA